MRRCPQRVALTGGSIRDVHAAAALGRQAELEMSVGMSSYRPSISGSLLSPAAPESEEHALLMSNHGILGQTGTGLADTDGYLGSGGVAVSSPQEVCYFKMDVPASMKDMQYGSLPRCRECHHGGGRGKV